MSLALAYTMGKKVAQQALAMHREASPIDHPDASITTAKITDGAVTTAKIADGAVTIAKTDFTDQALKTTSSPTFASLTVSGNATVKGTLSVGDIEFKNGWRIVEDERHGLLLISPSGRKYRFTLQEVVE